MTEAGQALDQERQEKARAYARQRRQLSLLELLVGIALLGLWLFFAWGPKLGAALEDWSPVFSQYWWLKLLAIAFVIGLGWQVLTLPIDYVHGFFLPHRYDMSTQSLSAWIKDLLKSTAVSIVLIIPLLLGLYALIRGLPNTWWLWAAAMFSLVTVVLSALAPVLLMPIFFELQRLGEEHAALVQRLKTLAAQAGTHVRGVFSIDLSRRTRAANAALTGLGKTRRILLGDTLLEHFSADEIEAVLAHELGHHVHKDIPLQISVQTGFNFGAFFLAHWLLARFAPGLGLAGPGDPAGLPTLAALFGMLGLILMPITNAFSRWREHLADDYALQVTQKPLAFASAMTRLANQNLADVDPKRWVVLLLYSHPPLRDRIAKAESFYQGLAQSNE